MADDLLPTSTVTRRQLIRFLGAACAGLLSVESLSKSNETVNATPFINAYLAPAGTKDRAGRVLLPAQLKDLGALMNVLLPATDTRGARELGCHYFIDHQLSACESPAEARKFISELERFSSVTRAHWQKPYVDLPVDSQNDIMGLLARSKDPYLSLGEGFYSKLRSLGIFSYYLSEEGFSKALIYLPLPGGFEGNYKLERNNNRAFSPRIF